MWFRACVFLIVWQLCLPMLLPAQTNKIRSTGGTGEQPAAFRGDLRRYISENLYYPPIAQMNGLEGRSLIGFRITKQGNIDSIEVITSSHPLLDSEAVRLVKHMPKWKPTMVTKRGKATDVYPVNSHFTLPINFLLEDDSGRVQLDSCEHRFRGSRSSQFDHFPNYLGSYGELCNMWLDIDKKTKPFSVFVVVQVNRKGLCSQPIILCSTLNEELEKKIKNEFANKIVHQKMPWFSIADKDGQEQVCDFIIPIVVRPR